MPDCLLDSNAISAVMQCDPNMERMLHALNAEEQVVTSVVVEGEILFGIARLPEGSRKRALAAALAGVLERLHDILDLDSSMAGRYAALKADLYARGLPIGENDLWIAATALEHGLVLVTRDVHFKSIPGLRIQDWSESQS